MHAPTRKTLWLDLKSLVVSDSPFAVVDGDGVFDEVVVRRQSVGLPLLDAAVVRQELEPLLLLGKRDLLLGQLGRGVLLQLGSASCIEIVVFSKRERERERERESLGWPALASMRY